jgi:hypothetical protein
VLTEGVKKAFEVNIRNELSLYGMVLIAMEPDGTARVVSLTDHEVVIKCLHESASHESERSHLCVAPTSL